jgi:hypothetical protein
VVWIHLAQGRAKRHVSGNTIMSEGKFRDYLSNYYKLQERLCVMAWLVDHNLAQLYQTNTSICPLQCLINRMLYAYSTAPHQQKSHMMENVWFISLNHSKLMSILRYL